MSSAQSPAVAVGDRREGRVRRALGFSLLNTAVGRLGTFVTGIVLARLLAPADFGVFAVALVVLNGLLAVNEMGVSLAMVRCKGDPREIAPTVTTISLASSAVLYGLCWVSAPVLAAALGAPEATGVVRLLCVSVLIDGLTAAAAQFVNREFRQGIRLAVDMSNLVLTTGVTVVLSIEGHGASSLAWGRLLGNALSALLLFRLAALWPRPGFDPAQARDLLRFGLPLAGASLLVMAMLNVDFAVAGHLLGAVALGLYYQAFNLSSWPVNMFSMVVRRVSFAAFAEVSDEPALREDRLARLACLLAVVTLPVCALLGLLAEPVVVSLYGEAWRPGAAALQFLAVLGAVRVAAELGYDYLVALGASRKALVIQGLWLSALVVALPAGALIDGIRGIGAAHAAVAVCLILPIYLLAVRRSGVSLRALAAAVARPVVGCGLLVVAVLAVQLLAPTTSSWQKAILASVAGAAVYLPVVYPLRRRLLQPMT